MLNRGLIWVTVILSLSISLLSYRFLAQGLEAAFTVMEEHIRERETALLLHVSFAPIALALSPFQMMPRLRARRPGLHRWMGRMSAASILISGLAGLTLAVGALDDRPVAGLGFGLLALLWIGTTLRAVQHVLARRIDLHRRWMIRSFALTLAAVTLRLELPLIMALGQMDYAQGSVIVAWLCWVPNLIVAELYLRKRTERVPLVA